MQQKELLKWEISRLTTRRESYRAQSRPETPSDQSFPYLLRSISEDSLRASKTCVFDPSRASVTRRAPGRANFPANYSLRRLLTYPHWKYRKAPSVAIFRPVKPVATCRESQFSDFAPLTGPMTHKNSEIPTYTQSINKVVVFTLSQQIKLGLLRRESVLTPSHFNRWHVKGDDKSSVISMSSATQTVPTAPETKRRSRFFQCYWQTQTRPSAPQYHSGSSTS